jgi:uncharacterized protein (TIGR02246 family)
MEAAHLVDIEEIKQLKARYFRLMDTGQWEAWAEVFAEDASLRWGPEEGAIVHGRDRIVKSVRRILKDAVTVHHGHMPEIEILSSDRARGIWSMFDHVDTPEFELRGFGHYEEEYVKRDGRWVIHRLVLTRLREDRRSKTEG